MATFDTLIRGGKGIDGTGNPRFYGDVAINDDKIEAIEPHAKIDPVRGERVTDADRPVIGHGFIDLLFDAITPGDMDRTTPNRRFVT